jgi:cytochrome b561
MMMRNTSERWGIISQAFHWLTLLLILGMLLSGFAFADWVSDTATRVEILQWHKSFGILILTLTILRLVWRVINPSPPLPDNMQPYERVLAKFTHLALYVLLIAMPLIGWLMISTSSRNIPTVVFGLFTLPRIASPDKAMHEFYEEAHEAVAFIIIAIVAFHAIAALKHHFVIKDNVLRRMLPGRGV